MSQATIGDAPYRNSGLFADYYLRERVHDLEDWDCDEAADRENVDRAPQNEQPRGE